MKNLRYRNFCPKCGVTVDTVDDPGECPACGHQMNLGRCIDKLWNVAPTDTMNPTLSHADGKIYTSKSQYLNAIDRKGCHVIEAGETPKRMMEKSTVGQDLSRAYDQVTSQRGKRGR